MLWSCQYCSLDATGGQESLEVVRQGGGRQRARGEVKRTGGCLGSSLFVLTRLSVLGGLNVSRGMETQLQPCQSSDVTTHIK